ncbi:MAG: hypothetical protein GY810_05175 [Aureispira sp.]|nr:hypothetical protein [Aureispira sp.]
MKQLFLVVIALLCLQTSEAQYETRHLHVLRIMDSLNYSPIIRQASVSISRRVDQEVDALMHNLGILTVHNYHITGYNFTPEYLAEVVEEDMMYCEGDIVMIVYVGHGFQSIENTTQYPQFYMGGSTKNSVYYTDLLMDIIDKKPSVVLSIVNACNDEIGEYTYAPKTPTRNQYVVHAAPKYNNRRSARYRELFKPQSSYMATVIEFFSSKEGQATYVMPDGGIFFNEAIDALQLYLSSAYAVVWSDIFTTVSKKTIQKSLNEIDEIQMPICQVQYYMHPDDVHDGTSRVRKRSAKAQKLYQWRQDKKAMLKRQRKEDRAAMYNARQNGQSLRERRALAKSQKQNLRRKKRIAKDTKIRIVSSY